MQPSSRLRSFSSRQLPTVPRAVSLKDLNFGKPGSEDLNRRVRPPPEVGGPHDTAGKLFSDLGKVLEAPRLQMSHRRPNGGAAMCSDRITVLPLGAGVVPCAAHHARNHNADPG